MAIKTCKINEAFLQEIINNAVMRALCESYDKINELNYLDDIKNGTFSQANINFINTTYDEATLEVQGASGAEYNITVAIDGKWSPGMDSHDYDIPNDNPQTEEVIDDVKIEYYDETNNEWINLPYDGNDDELNQKISENITVDWSEYDPYDDYYEE